MRLCSAGALAALAIGAAAQTPTSISPDVQRSVLMALATAIPSESASYALASPSAFAAQMASSLSAGNTPAWYQKLPADVKSLLPAVYPAVASPTPTPSALSSSVAPSVSARPTGVNSTSISTVHAPTLSASGSAARSSAPAAATGAATLPSAAIGAGLGAVLGFVGMLAL